MCTNRALVNSLECYMDDLVDCFEDFVKKSLVLISVGVGTVVIMLAYMLKVLTDTDRTGTPGTGADQTSQPPQQCQSNTGIQSIRERSLKQPNAIQSDFTLQYCEPKLVCKSANTLPIPVVPSFDERVLRDTGFSNCNRVSPYSLRQPNAIQSEFMLQYCEPKLVCKSANTLPIPVVPSFYERVLRDTGFSNCNRNFELTKRTARNCSTSRTSLSNQPTCLSKQHLSPPWTCLKELKRASCCSMDGDDVKSNRIS